MCAHERTFAGGARLMHEGETADHVIVILSGRTRICVEDDGVEHVIAHRGPGQLVGERAALRVSVRSATVVALTQVRALVVTTEDFAGFLSTHPFALDLVEGQVYERLREDPTGRSSELAASAAGEAVHPQVLNGENCTIIFTDVAAFGSPERTDEHRRIIRRELFEMTSSSLRDIWKQCYWEDRGDGHLIVVPPNIPTKQVLECLGGALPVALRRHNNLYGTGARIQLRVAVNVGPVTSDKQGVSGQVIINAARLVDAPPLKAAVAADRANLGLIVSDFVHESAIRCDGSQANPGVYAEVEVNVKEACLRAWVQVIDPSLPAPPLPKTSTRSLEGPGHRGPPDEDELCTARGWVGYAG